SSVFFAFFAFLAFFAALVPFVLPSSFFISPPAGAAGAAGVAGVAGVAGGADGACAKVEEMKARPISTAKIAARIVFIADSPPSSERHGSTGEYSIGCAIMAFSYLSMPCRNAVVSRRDRTSSE